jgi:hypothetical protein
MSFAVRVDENLIALSWYGLPSLEGIKALEGAFAQVTTAQRRKIAFATRIHAQANPEKAPADVRNAVAALLKRFAGRLAATVVIYESPGWKATATRTIIATINLLSRSSFPSEVHAKMGTGVSWLVQRLGPDAPADAEKRLNALLA